MKVMGMVMMGFGKLIIGSMDELVMGKYAMGVILWRASVGKLCKSWVS